MPKSYATLEENVRACVPAWWERIKTQINATQEDVIQAVLVDPHGLNEFCTLLKAPTQTPELRLVYKTAHALIYRRTRKGRTSPAVPAPPSEVGDAMHLLKEYQQLLQEEAGLEERLKEVRSRKADLAPVQGALRALTEVVRKTKEEVHRVAPLGVWLLLLIPYGLLTALSAVSMYGA